MSMDLTDDKSTLVQVMAWCRQTTSHYLSQCWPRSMTPCGVTRPQWVKCHWHIYLQGSKGTKISTFIIYSCASWWVITWIFLDLLIHFWWNQVRKCSSRLLIAEDNIEASFAMASADTVNSEHQVWAMYCQTSNISGTLVDNEIVDHSGVVGTSPVILNLTPGFNGLGRNNCNMRWDTFNFWDLVCLVLEVWQYMDVTSTVGLKTTGLLVQKLNRLGFQKAHEIIYSHG